MIIAALNSAETSIAQPQPDYSHFGLTHMEPSSLVGVLAIVGVNYSSPLSRDVAEFLWSAIYLAGAVAMLDHADERETEAMCYELLADVKRKLNEVTLHRALE
jgi:hypothetical protein